MISFNIPAVKDFMAKLLASTFFDHLILKEMEINTFTSFRVSGQFYKEFYTEEEIELRKYPAVLWGEIREIAFTIIKGSKSPLSMKIVLQLPPDQTREFLQEIPGVNEDDVGGLFINIRFEKEKLDIITGNSMTTFTMDKTLDREWDAKVKEFFKINKIPIEENY